MKIAEKFERAMMAAAFAEENEHETARVEEIVQGKCFICHGADGESSSPVFPRLAGQHARYIERQLADYKSGKRASSTMKPISDHWPRVWSSAGRGALISLRKGLVNE